MIKRFVDPAGRGARAGELERARDTAAADYAAPAACAQAPPLRSRRRRRSPLPARATGAGRRCAGPVSRRHDEDEWRERTDAPPAPTASSLPELAREAAMSAEREAIQQALDRFRWNRRKAAELPQRQLQDAAQQDEGVRHQRAGLTARDATGLVRFGQQSVTVVHCPSSDSSRTGSTRGIHAFAHERQPQPQTLTAQIGVAVRVCARKLAEKVLHTPTGDADAVVADDNRGLGRISPRWPPPRHVRAWPDPNI